MEENNIEVRGLCKTQGKFTLDHVSFTVPKGRIVGLIGENGAGKSTTINLILNEWKPDGGEIRILEKATLATAGRMLSVSSLTSAISRNF